MEKPNDLISNALGIEHEPEVLPPVKVETPGTPQPTVHTNIDEKEDYEFARQTMREVLEKGKTALENAIDLADAYEKPSAYDAIANLIKTMTDSSEKLYGLQKTAKDIRTLDRKIDRASDLGGNGINVEKAVFVGTTAELLSQLKNTKHNE